MSQKPTNQPKKQKDILPPKKETFNLVGTEDTYLLFPLFLEQIFTE
jgi:hypothetical protein